jgi:hypothetical protein
MNDPENDWLDTELKALGELEAPKTLLPRVMSEVRTRAARPWLLQIFSAHAGLMRALITGFALALLVLSAISNVFDPTRMLIQGSPILRGLSTLLASLEAVLVQSKIASLPLFVILGVLTMASYLVCIASAKAVHRLAHIR